jgi:two-component system cell cycle sensor histidine kinase/response regulator CckA
VRKGEIGRNRETILVVEDTDDVRRMICQILLQDGYTVLEAANGVEALEISDTCKDIHLVLTDVVMPQMNGRELAEHLSRTQPSTRLIFMSGYTEDPMVVNAIGRLAFFLAKPFTPVTLTSKIREVLDRPIQESDQTR